MGESDVYKPVHLVALMCAVCFLCTAYEDLITMLVLEEKGQTREMVGGTAVRLHCKCKDI